MALLKLLYYPDERLREIAKPVININDDIRLIVDNMFETMYAKNGIGLAAIQVGIQKQIIVIDISANQNEQLVLINLRLLETSGQIHIDEGCLSIPNQYALVPRAKKIKVQAQDQYGNNFDLEASDLLAICIQHEMDHLIGKLFIDYLSPLKRKIIQRKVKKFIRINTNTKTIKKI
ncbi:peptide deformylase [Sodalis sp. CWE]|uniref:peptide deformylase n=1 Tax=Sodalis sp. CWE TaxID=2803816 RepID=UPI001C7DED52|nr:peptide deformylase [Sodalis sp. CWE]MBX4180858.1 peptide deformylase [Sodalis sp. CWE]